MNELAGHRQNGNRHIKLCKATMYEAFYVSCLFFHMKVYNMNPLYSLWKSIQKQDWKASLIAVFR